MRFSSFGIVPRPERASGATRWEMDCSSQMARRLVGLTLCEIGEPSLKLLHLVPQEEEDKLGHGKCHQKGRLSLGGR